MQKCCWPGIHVIDTFYGSCCLNFVLIIFMTFNFFSCDANLRNSLVSQSKMIVAGLISRTVNKYDVVGNSLRISNAIFKEIKSIDTNGGAICMDNNDKTFYFESVSFIKCSSIMHDSRGGAIFFDCINSTIRANAVNFHDCSANYGQSMYIKMINDAKFVRTRISDTVKNDLVHQDSMIELYKTYFKFIDSNETDNCIKGDVSCVKATNSRSNWDHCIIKNNTCNCYSLFFDGGNHMMNDIIFKNNTQMKKNDLVVFIGSVNIEATNVNECSFNIKGSNDKNLLSIVRKKLADDETIANTYYDKDYFYRNRDSADDSVNMLFIYVGVPIICLVVFLIALIWYFIAKLCLPNYYFDDIDNDENDIVNDPKFTDSRYFLDRNISASVVANENGVQTSIRKKHRITLSDGEEEDEYYSDEDKKEKKDEMELKEIRTMNNNNNNPLWAASLMNDTDDPFGDDFEEDIVTRLYKKGSSITPKIEKVDTQEV